MPSTSFRLALVPALAAAFASVAGAETRYEAVDIGSLGVGYTIAEAMNRAGHVVGSSSKLIAGFPVQHAFLWRNGSMTDLGVLAAGQISSAVAVNATDQVVGWSTSSLTDYHGWIWQNGAMTELPFWHIGGIDDSGRVIGAKQVAAGSWHLVSWKAGVLSDLGDAGGDNMFPTGSNNAGVVVGTRGRTGMPGYIRYPDTWSSVIDLGNPHTGHFVTPKAITDDGWVAGMEGGATDGGNAGIWQAFLWKDGQYTHLPSLVVGAQASAWGVNHARQLVGYSYTVVNGGTMRAALWENGTCSNLNDRLVGGSPAVGDLAYAVDISDAGTIAVNGDSRVVTFLNQKVYVLKPVTVASSSLADSSSGDGATSASVGAGASAAAAGGSGGKGCGVGSGVAALLVGLAMMSVGRGRGVRSPRP